MSADAAADAAAERRLNHSIPRTYFVRGIQLFLYYGISAEQELYTIHIDFFVYFPFPTIFFLKSCDINQHNYHPIYKVGDYCHQRLHLQLSVTNQSGLIIVNYNIFPYF